MLSNISAILFSPRYIKTNCWFTYNTAPITQLQWHLTSLCSESQLHFTIGWKINWGQRQVAAYRAAFGQALHLVWLSVSDDLTCSWREPPCFPGVCFQHPLITRSHTRQVYGLCGPDCTLSQLWGKFRVNRLVTQSIAIPSLPCLPGQAPPLRMLEPTIDR